MDQRASKDPDKILIRKIARGLVRRSRHDFTVGYHKPVQHMCARAMTRRKNLGGGFLQQKEKAQGMCKEAAVRQLISIF